MKIRTSLFHRSGRMVAMVAMAAVAIPAAAVGAQQASHNIELRPFVGAMVPTGDQRDLLESSVLTGGELSWQFRPNFAVTGSFGWAPSNDRTLADRPTVDLYQYDVALEGRLDNLLSSSAWSLRPYARLGAGGRTYNYRNVEGTNAQTDFVGHGAIGIDVAPAASRVGLRVEARDNVSAFRGLRGEMNNRVTRNDMQFTTGLTIRM
jgi:hypothetical protein